MNVALKVDINPLLKLTGALARQIPFALVKAINGTSYDIRDAHRAELGTRMILRTPQSARYLQKSIDLLERAEKKGAKFEAKLGVRPGGLLEKFERGGVRTANNPLKPFALPTQELRATGREVIPRALFPINLGLTPYRDPTGRHFYAQGRGTRRKSHTPFKGNSIRGTRRTFVLDPRTMPGLRPEAWGVYQRLSGRKGDIRMIWSYRRTKRIPAILGQEETIKRVGPIRWPIQLANAVEYAIRTAR